MAYLTPQYIYRRQHPSDLPPLRALGLHHSAAPNCCMSVLDRKTLTVVGSVCREVLADENHRAYAQHLSALAATPAENAVFIRDMMRGLSPASASLPWLLPDDFLQLQTIQAETISLTTAAQSRFRDVFGGATAAPDGNGCTLSTGNGCTFLLRAEALPCGLRLTAGFTPYDCFAAPFMNTLLTLRMSRFADTEADVTAFISDAQAMYSPLCGADKAMLKACHSARQKTFLQRIDTHLKPLGFRKRVTRWELTTNGTDVIFEAQKSRFGDQFFLNLRSAAASSAIRLEQDIDWQLLSDADIDDLMRLYLAEDILPLITPAPGGTP